MSTSLLYHGFGVRGYEHVRTEYLGKEVVFTIRQERGRLRCSACGGRNVHPHGQVKRRFRAVPIGGKPVRIVLPIPRVSCPACGVLRQVQIGFADRRRSYTKSFERYALDLARHMTIQDVAEHLVVSWDVIKDIQRRDLTRRFARPKLKSLRQIAIDEISIGKGHHYLTVVLDLQSGAVVFVGDGKGADALVPFWRRVRRSGARIAAVAMDMSAAYITAVSTHLPEAAIVFDHFHVVKLFNEKLSNLRRDLYREATDRMHKEVLKGTRWLLLKNPGNLNHERKESERLQQALRLNQPLALAYYMKEELRLLWSKPNKDEAETFLADWINRAMVSGIRMLMNFAKTLAAHRTGILAYYDYRISTGPLEGTNNKIKTMKRQAYGFRDHEFFKLKILALHETKYALVG
jgi:transposase